MRERSLLVLEFDKIRAQLGALAVTPPGRRFCEALVPSNAIREVERAQALTEEAVVLLSFTGGGLIAPFDECDAAISRAAVGSTLSPRELLNVGSLLRAARSARQAILSHEERAPQIPLLREMAQGLLALRGLEDEIFSAILSEDEIADQASPALASLRRKMRASNERVRERLNGLLHSLGKYLQEPIITIRSGRYVLPVKAENRQSVPGLVHDQSGSGATLFIEPMAVVEINNELREMAAQEREEIERILAALSSAVAVEEGPLLVNAQILGEMDFCFAKGALSRAMGASQPKINEKGKINIKRGRHPLIARESVVPLDLWVGEEFTSLVVTGPNTGGKTVTLKTVGLFTLMMQAGLQLPADLGTELSLFDEVFADIGDEQSIEQSLSTFSSHMTNIVSILSEVTSRSLVLFDELGAGTDPTEGAALAMAILDTLAARKTVTLATTHYSELKAYALTHPGVSNASVEFNVETLRPTYRLSIGVPGRSNAFEISKRLGLSDGIIEKARGWLSGEQIRFEDVISTAEGERQLARRERELAAEARARSQSLLDEVEREREALKNARQKLIQEAREEARRVVRSAQAEAENVIQRLKEADEGERARAAQQARQSLQKGLNELRDQTQEAPPAGKPLGELRVGQSVLIAHLGLEATVLELPDRNGEALLQAGLMKLKQPLSALREPKGTAKTQKGGAQGQRRAVAPRSTVVSLEIDVRGRLPEEALEEVDKYLDDAVLAGLSEVSVVHGKGTGVLRDEIGKLLRRHPHVAEYRLGRFGEGESGVTIIKLK
ncbi:MAG: endonuclease MutS2 [Christensenellaceae bacterium]|nr:endonuclease MutS2 [Christensenellaceae bacterium]